MKIILHLENLPNHSQPGLFQNIASSVIKKNSKKIDKKGFLAGGLEFFK